MAKDVSRARWHKDGGVEALRLVLKMHNVPDWVMQQFECMGLREKYNKRHAIPILVAERSGEWRTKLAGWSTPRVFNWDYIRTSVGPQLP